MRFSWRATAWSAVALFLCLGCGKPRERRHDARPRRDSQSESRARRLSSSARPISDWPLISNLPLVLVDTSGQRIPDEPKIPARMKLIYNPHGEKNSLAEGHVQFEGPIEIEIRGKSSQQFPKKQYSLKLKTPVSLLEMPPAKDWILNGPYSDKTLMRNFLAYEFSNQMGRYAPRTRFVEVVLNDDGQAQAQSTHYAGVYLLLERIERGPDRVRIGYDTSRDERGDDPAFLMKIDKMDGSDRSFGTRRGTQIIHVYPKGNPTDADTKSAERYMDAFESALAAASDHDEEYLRLMDLNSFVDYFLLNEFFKNIDAYRLSAFFHKDRGGKLRMGPVWDFNLSLGNADYYGGSNTRGWLVDHVPAGEGYPVPFWWKRLFQLRPFHETLRTRWRELRRDILADAELAATIDQTAASLEEAQKRNFEKWPVLGRYVWPNPSPHPRTYPAEIQQLKHWITGRARWMDEELR